MQNCLNWRFCLPVCLLFAVCFSESLFQVFLVIPFLISRTYLEDSKEKVNTFTSLSFFTSNRKIIRSFSFFDHDRKVPSSPFDQTFAFDGMCMGHIDEEICFNSFHYFWKCRSWLRRHFAETNIYIVFHACIFDTLYNIRNLISNWHLINVKSTERSDR